MKSEGQRENRHATKVRARLGVTDNLIFISGGGNISKSSARANELVDGERRVRKDRWLFTGQIRFDQLTVRFLAPREEACALLTLSIRSSLKGDGGDHRQRPPHYLSELFVIMSFIRVLSKKRSKATARAPDAARNSRTGL